MEAPSRWASRRRFSVSTTSEWGALGSAFSRLSLRCLYRGNRTESRGYVSANEAGEDAHDVRSVAFTRNRSDTDRPRGQYTRRLNLSSITGYRCLADVGVFVDLKC